ncbi:MAG: hypothetical protein AAFX06_01110 [Planctomycetota bacterium]
MTTVICPEVFDQPVATKSRPSDAEILQRVRQIKSTWTLAERAERRREADRRFESLIDAIFAEAA